MPGKVLDSFALIAYFRKVGDRNLPSDIEAAIKKAL